MAAFVKRSLLIGIYSFGICRSLQEKNYRWFQKY
jgi:hypothetical protein